MPLPPNASITDVINKLTELEGINQKTELASVIGSPALSTDTVAQQIVKLQDSKDTLASNLNAKDVDASNTESVQSLASKVNDIPLGKVSGTSTVDNNTYSFNYYGSGSLSMRAIIVSGLTFKPSHISVIKNTTDTSSYSTQYFQNYGSYNEYVKVSIDTQSNNTGASTYGFKGNTGTAYVNETGFRLPVEQVGNYTWIAYK